MRHQASAPRADALIYIGYLHKSGTMEARDLLSKADIRRILAAMK
jgi:hypothetical protein